MMSVRSTRLSHSLYTSLQTLNGGLERSVTQLQTSCRRSWAIKSPKMIVCLAPQDFNFMQNRIRANSTLYWSGLSKERSTFCSHAFGNSGNTDASSGGGQSNESRKGGSFLAKLVKKLMKVLVAVLLSALLAVAALPYLISFSPVRKAAVFVANKSIPGTLNVSSISLGWTQPVHVEGFLLQGIDSERVVSVPKIETKAPLWSIVLGKSGFGDCKISSPVINLEQHPKNNLPRIALALTSAEKILEKAAEKKPQKASQKVGAKKPEQKVVPPANVAWTVEAKSPDGGLEVIDGKLILPSDAAAVLGDRLILSVNLGPYATNQNDELKLADDKKGWTPLTASLWSDAVDFQAVGFIQKRTKKIKLLKPLRAEMDLTPKVAKFYLARINPLLGEIVGPAIQDDDMPDVMVQITPTNLELPSDHYTINIAPMKVTLARGQVVDGILSLLSKQDLVKGRKNITMQTSAIEAKLDLPNKVESSRLDILIADKVHVATWGNLDLIDDSMQMTLAIPGQTLKDVLGLTKCPEKYYLKVAITGTPDNTKVDWKTAGLGIAELTARQRGGQFLQGFMDKFYSNDKSKSDTPEPIDVLPWEVRSAQ